MGTLDVTVLKAEILQEFPTFALVPKSSSTLMKIIGAIFVALSFGKTTSFMTSYTTTLGVTVYTPSVWDSWPSAQQCETLRHERVHMRQAKKYGRVWFSFLYLIAFFPIGLAYWRAKFEMEAYAESLATLQEMGAVLTDPTLKTTYVGFLTGPSYIWAWPFKGMVENWFDTTVAKLQSSAPPKNGA
jgi:hypothetical protein